MRALESALQGSAQARSIVEIIPIDFFNQIIFLKDAQYKPLNRLLDHGEQILDAVCCIAKDLIGCKIDGIYKIVQGKHNYILPSGEVISRFSFFVTVSFVEIRNYVTPLHIDVLKKLMENRLNFSGNICDRLIPLLPFIDHFIQHRDEITAIDHTSLLTEESECIARQHWHYDNAGGDFYFFPLDALHREMSNEAIKPEVALFGEMNPGDFDPANGSEVMDEVFSFVNIKPSVNS